MIDETTRPARRFSIDGQSESYHETLLRLEDDLKELRRKAATNWPLVGTMGTVAIAIITFIVGSMVAPLSASLGTLTLGTTRNANDIQTIRDAVTKSAAADAVSSIDRINLNEKTGDNTKLIADLNSRLAASDSTYIARTTEVETQIDATAQASAIQMANMLRKINELQASMAQMGAKVPSPTNDPYVFPNMSNRVPKGTTNSQ